MTIGEFLTEIFKYLSYVAGAAAGGLGASIFINRLVYKKPDPLNIRYPWKTMLAFSALFFVLAIIFNAIASIAPQDIFLIAFPIAVAQDLCIWGFVGAASLVRPYYKRHDYVLTILLNWNKVRIKWG